MEAEKKREVVIRVRDLYKVYRMGDTKVYALNGVDLDICRGEFCAITGPSGSGKSTLLNMLAGLEHPSKGEIVIAGKHIEKLNEKQLVTFRRERVGFIFQSYNLIATMDAVENVALPLSFRGMGKAKRAKRAKEYLKLVGLERFMTHMPNQMSGGQQQRVGIARALVVDLYSGVAEAMKLGAVASFIMGRDGVEVLESEHVPAGVMNPVEPVMISKKLWDGDRIVMVSDGILDAMPGAEKEAAFSDFLAGLPAAGPQETAEMIMAFALSFDGEPRDDMTVLVGGIYGR